MATFEQKHFILQACSIVDWWKINFLNKNRKIFTSWIKINTRAIMEPISRHFTEKLVSKIEIIFMFVTYEHWHINYNEFGLPKTE